MNSQSLLHRVRRAARLAALELKDLGADAPPRWSHTVAEYYPVESKPRWGYGSPPNPHLLRALEAGRARYEESLSLVADCRDVLHAIPHTAATPLSPQWNSSWFSCLDAAALVAFLLARKPKRLLEIGSGTSTVFAAHAVRVGGLPTSITSIDPQPRREVNELCDRVIRSGLETCDLTLFDELEPGDILFFDGSHRIFTNSDVAAFFFDVLPRVRPGVLVHVHDVFLPNDYPPEWNDRLYSEQYLIGAMLLCPKPPFRVVLPNYFASTDACLSEQVRGIFRSPTGGPDIPLFYYGNVPGVSFWFEMHS